MSRVYTEIVDKCVGHDIKREGVKGTVEEEGEAVVLAVAKKEKKEEARLRWRRTKS